MIMPRMTIYKFMSLALIACSLWACKAIEPIVEDNLDPNKKYIAVSPDDVVQSISFSKLENDDRVLEGQLENGVTYYIMPNSKPENRAELRLVIKAGSIDEESDQLGVAHFIEHMAFNGTRNFEKNELIDYLESVGTQFGPDLNAYTSFDETVYKLQVRTNDEEQLKKGFLVLSDWASGLTFDEEEIDNERGVVISEWRSNLSAAQRMQNEYLPTLLKGSRYARRLPIGDPDIIKNASYGTIKQFYFDWYRPELMAVVAVGDFNVNLIEDYINDYFARLPKAINPKKKKTYLIGSHDETLVKVCTDEEAAMTQVRIVNKMPERRLSDINDFKERLITSLYIRILNERLKELAKSNDPPFLYGSASYGKEIGPMDIFSNFATCHEGKTEQAIEALIRENLRAQKHGVTASELERAKSALMKIADGILKEKDKTQSGYLTMQYVRNFLYQSPYLSPESYHSLVSKYLPIITVDDVSNVASLWKSEDQVILITGPKKKGVSYPDRREVLEIMDRVGQEALEAYKEEVISTPLLDFVPESPRIESEERVDAIDLEIFKMTNGTQVLVKPTQNNNDEIILKAFAEGGSSEFDVAQAITADHAGWIINDSGLSTFSSVDLGKKLTGKKIRINSYVGFQEHGLTGSCGTEEAETLAQLAYLFLTDVRKDSASFISFRDRMTAYYSNLMADPSYYFYNKVLDLSLNSNPRFLVPTSQQIEKLDFHVVHEIYQDLFQGGYPFTFILVGNVTPEIKDVFLRYISSLPSAGGGAEDGYRIDYRPESRTYKWEKGNAPKTFVEAQFYCEDEQFDNYRLYELKVLKRIADIKLREELREDQGGVYGVSTFIKSKSYAKGKYVFGYRFNADPEKAQELIESANEVLYSLAGEGLKTSDLDKVKEIMKQRYFKGIERNEFWVDALQTTVTEDLDFERITEERVLAKIESIDPGSLRELAGSTFAKDSLATFIQNPE